MFKTWNELYRMYTQKQPVIVPLPQQETWGYDDSEIYGPF